MTADTPINANDDDLSKKTETPTDTTKTAEGLSDTSLDNESAAAESGGPVQKSGSDVVSESETSITTSAPEADTAKSSTTSPTKIPSKTSTIKAPTPKDPTMTPVPAQAAQGKTGLGKTDNNKVDNNKAENKKSDNKKTDNNNANTIKANKKISTPRRDRGVLRWLTLLLALAAVAGSGYTYWQQQQFIQKTNEGIAQMEGSAASLKRDLQTEVQSQLNSIATDTRKLKIEIEDANEALSKTLKVEFVALADRIFENERQLVRLKGYTDEVKYAYVKAEVEYFLQMANNRLLLAQDMRSALAALEAADERLNILRDPSLTAVRAQVLDEIEALKAVVQPDIEGLALRLFSLSKAVAKLPLRMHDDQAAYLKNDIQLKEGEGFRVAMSNVWRNMKGTLDQLVEVRDATPSDVPLLSVSDVALVYTILDIQLHTARLAALKGDATNYTVSIEKAEQLLQVYFDSEEIKVAAIIQSLAEIKAIDIAPALPDISRSLMLLRESRSEAKVQAGSLSKSLQDLGAVQEPDKND